MRNDGTGQLSVSDTITVSDEATGVACDDADGDGDADLAVSGRTALIMLYGRCDRVGQ